VHSTLLAVAAVLTGIVNYKELNDPAPMHLQLTKQESHYSGYVRLLKLEHLQD
jgi:hypothetical protein